MRLLDRIRRPGPWLAVAVLLAAPALLLSPCLFGDRTYLPFDLAEFPPARLMLDEAERAAIAATPANHDVTEIPVLVVPELELARAELAADRFPHWNPYARFGAPLFGNGLAAMAYPPNALLLLGLHPQDGLAIGAWLTLSIAGLLAFALLRRLGFGTLAALLGAVAFGLGGTVTVNAPFYMRANALIWLPGLLLGCTSLATARGSARALPAAGTALATGMTLLAGFPPFAVASLLVTALWSLALLTRAAVRGGARAALALACWLGAAVALGVALSAVQVAPMFAFFPESNREVTPDLAVTLEQAIDPMVFVGYLMPTALGEPGGLPAVEDSPLAHLLWTRRTLDGERLLYPIRHNFTEYAVFAGTLPALLALLGAITLRRRAMRVTAAILVGLFALALAPGFLEPFYRLPVVASVPPLRYVAPAALLVALLAAGGLDALLAGTARRRSAAVAIAAALLALVCAALAASSPLGDTDAVVDALAARYDVPAGVVLDELCVRPARNGSAAHDLTVFADASARLDAALTAAAGSLAAAAGWLLLVLWLPARGRRIAVVAALAVTLVELGGFAWPRNSGRELRHDPSDTPIHRFLVERDRALAASGGVTVARVAAEAKDLVDLPPGMLFPLRVRDLNSYAFVDRWSHRAFLALYGKEQMIRSYWPRAFPDDERLNRPFFDLIGLRYLLTSSRRPMRHAGVPVGPTVEGPNGERFVVYERPAALPRAFVVHRTRVLPDEAAVVTALVAPELAPRSEVLLTPAEAARLPAPADAADAPRTARFLRDDPDRIELEIDDGPAGLLVLADAALSGWSVRVDGVPVESARGNLFMRVVPVPAGAARVELRYRTPGLAAGAVTSVFALLVLLGLLGVGLRSWHLSRRSSPRRPISDGSGDSTTSGNA